MTKRTRFLIALVLLVMVPSVAWQALDYSWYQGALPLGVTAPLVQYKTTKTYGLGPGGNGAGIVVYRMDSQTAARLKDRGIAYLNEAASEDGPLTREQRRKRDRRTYTEWRATPVPLQEVGNSHGDHTCGREPGLGSYLDTFDFRCRVSSQVIRDANRLLSAPGSYYAYRHGRSARVIVAPDERKVIYAYVD